MQDSGLNNTLEIINCFVSFVFALTFMLNTILQQKYEGPPKHDNKEEWLRLMEISTIIYLATDFVFNFLISENRITFIFSFQSFVTYISVIPQSMISFEIIKDDK